MDLPEIEVVRRVTYSPDDVIVVRLKGAATAEDLHRLWATVREAFPTQRVLVLDDCATLDVVSPEPLDGRVIERSLIELRNQRGGQRLGFDV
jgi:hypothetical protein